MVTKRVAITPQQAELLLRLDRAVSEAAARANLAAEAVLAGHGVRGRLVQIDTDGPALIVEVDE